MEPLADACACLSQNPADPQPNPIEKEGYFLFLLLRVSRAQHCHAKRGTPALLCQEAQYADSVTQVLIERVHCFQAAYPEPFKSQVLLFESEILLDPPTHKVQSGYADDILFAFDRPVRRQHHRRV